MAVLFLTGVIEDGTPPERRPVTVPQNPRVTVTMSQKTSLTIKLSVRLASGPLVEVNDTTDTYTLRVRKQPGSNASIKVVGEKADATEGLGRLDFQIDPNMTLPQRMPWGRYTWTLTRVRVQGDDIPDLIDDVIPLSPWVVEPSDSA